MILAYIYFNIWFLGRIWFNLYGIYYMVITYEYSFNIWYIYMARFDMVWRIILYGWFNIYVWHIMVMEAYMVVYNNI
jgi:hypothetical protein